MTTEIYSFNVNMNLSETTSNPTL